jgi:hypothetical protein
MRTPRSVAEVRVFNVSNLPCLFLIAFALFTGPVSAESGSELLAQIRAASGGEAWDGIRTIRAEGVETAAGLQGPWLVIQDLAHGRFAQFSDFRVFRTADVYDGTTRWKQDRSGGVHALNADFSVRYARTDAWMTTRAYLRPGAQGAEIGSAAERVDGAVHYLVLTATPIGGEPVELWFDAGTKLLARTVRQRPLDVLIERWSEYRSVDGIMLPFQMDSGPNGSDDVVAIKRYSVSSIEKGAAFARPTPPNDTRVSGVSRIPAEIDGEIVITARVNGQGPFKFILDTGGHNILSEQAARTLGLTAVGNGRSGGSGAGTILEQDVRVQSLSIGGAELRDQHFFVLPLSYATLERGPRAPLAGILGLELFERFVVQIDYRHSTVTLAPPGPLDTCRGTSVPIRFDDDMPLVDGSVDRTPGVIAIDTGNGASTVIQGFWAKNNAMAAALKQGVETVSFGEGGASRNWISRGHSVSVGTASVFTELRYAEDRAGAFSSRTEAANAGYDILANFTVTFDYGRDRMCMAPSPGFELPPMNRSGLSLSKGEPGAFTAVLVRDGSPGAAAGVHVGDRIVAIDGRPASELSSKDAFKAVRGLPGSMLRLAISHDGQTSEVTVVLREPVELTS